MTSHQNQAMRKPSRLRRSLMRNTFLVGSFAGAVVFGTVTGILVTARPEIAYAAMAVIDSSNLAKNAETAAQTAKLLQTANDTKGIIDIVRRTMGMGANFGGNSPFRVSSSGTVLGGVYAAKRAVPNTQRIFGGRPANLSDPTTARNSVKEHLSSVDGLKPNEERQRQLDRRQAADEAQEQALGLALYMYDDLSRNGENRLRSLAEQAEAAALPAESGGDLRLQIANLTATQLAVLDELQQHRLLAAAALQLTASRSMLEAPSTQLGNPGQAARTNPKQGGSLFE